MPHCSDCYLHNWRGELLNVPFMNQFLRIILCVLLLPLLKLMKTIIKSKNLGWLTWIQSIYLWRQVKSQNWHLRHKLPQSCGVSKYIYPVWIRTTYNFLIHTRTIFRINYHWSSKWNTHKSTINKRRIKKKSLKDILEK